MAKLRTAMIARAERPIASPVALLVLEAHRAVDALVPAFPTTARAWMSAGEQLYAFSRASELLGRDILVARHCDRVSASGHLLLDLDRTTDRRHV
jgi:hypothetical protein